MLWYVVPGGGFHQVAEGLAGQAVHVFQAVGVFEGAAGPVSYTHLAERPGLLSRLLWKRLSLRKGRRGRYYALRLLLASCGGKTHS